MRGTSVSRVSYFSSYSRLRRGRMDPVETEMSSCPMETNECDDAESVVVASSTISDGFSTPASSRSIPFCVTSWTPECEEAKKPAIGMQFKDLAEAEHFYKSYAHSVGFSVRKGQSRTVGNEQVWKRFYCNRRGWRSEKEEIKSKRKTKITRCDCQAMITLKWKDNKYIVTSFFEDHTHELASPSKQQFLRSNREVSESAKSSLFTCHTASIGTSAAYRLFRVGGGGFEKVGCTKRDFQNYHRYLKCAINTSDAQMFIDNLARRKEANPAFFFDYMLDEQGRLVHIFWADTTSRKNYAHFGDVISFDSTYTTNQYNMIFAPFTGVNHHKQSIFLGAALISNEKAESYIWVFETLLKAMGGKKPSLIITDEAASMKIAIDKVLPTTTHRLCMWHIMRKVPEKVEPSLRNNDDFYACLNSCVWGSETAKEFEEAWSALVTDFSLEGNTWFAERYSIRDSWVPAYYKDIHLAGILRTTSRSESANSFFSHFIGYKYALVEFWLRFITALEEQRHNELIEENVNLQSMPELRTSWKIEKHASVVFTHKVFDALQKEILAAREYCVIESMRHDGEEKITIISDGRSSKVREVVLNTRTMDAHCTCKLFKSHGIPCRHVILVLRGARIDELPSQFVLKRWTKMCKKKAIFDEDGNLLEEKIKSPLDLEMQKKTSGARKDFEESIRLAAHSVETMDVVTTCLANLVDTVRQMVPADKQTRKDELESFLGCSIPAHIEIHPPSDVRSPGKCKRIKGHLDKGGKKNKVAGNKEKGKTIRMCSLCHQLGTHDKRTCHTKSTL